MADSGSVMERVRFIAALACGGAALVMTVEPQVVWTVSLMARRRSAPNQSGDKSHALHTQARCAIFTAIVDAIPSRCFIFSASPRLGVSTHF